ncbi:unnamed protein product [Zymoseptoria tritici ST99CH_1E4]|uniref:Uncharacterized protein n=1 Tax=Zymoseptoria tritici ST99CH_1E4 TaxID=1276532 RepID=A0A2H1GI08_ZYMTR|nr:unnamed protein product [Zymoseptoria tritici ST99CH_1E4]
MFFNQVLAAGAALIAVANGLAPPPNGPNAAPKGPLTPANGPKGPHSPKDGWPNAPFVNRGREMMSSKGETVTFAGHGEAMTPEGLYQSIRNMAQKVNDPDMNVIRLTYAIQMIDDIVDGNEFSLKHSFELHNYNNGLENGNCADFNISVGRARH